MEERTWLDDVAAINAIALTWFREVTQPTTTSAGTVTVSSQGIATSLSPGLVLVVVVLGVAVIWAANR